MTREERVISTAPEISFQRVGLKEQREGCGRKRRCVFSLNVETTFKIATPESESRALHRNAISLKFAVHVVASVFENFNVRPLANWAVEEYALQAKRGKDFVYIF